MLLGNFSTASVHHDSKSKTGGGGRNRTYSTRGNGFTVRRDSPTSPHLQKFTIIQCTPKRLSMSSVGISMLLRVLPCKSILVLAYLTWGTWNPDGDRNTLNYGVKPYFVTSESWRSGGVNHGMTYHIETHYWNWGDATSMPVSVRLMCFNMVHLGGIEPHVSRLKVWRPNQLDDRCKSVVATPSWISYISQRPHYRQVL
jgi:hypothetical protein